MPHGFEKFQHTADRKPHATSKIWVKSGAGRIVTALCCTFGGSRELRDKFMRTVCNHVMRRAIMIAAVRGGGNLDYQSSEKRKSILFFQKCKKETLRYVT